MHNIKLYHILNLYISVTDVQVNKMRTMHENQLRLTEFHKRVMNIDDPLKWVFSSLNLTNRCFLETIRKLMVDTRKLQSSWMSCINKCKLMGFYRKFLYLVKNIIFFVKQKELKNFFFQKKPDTISRLHF
jgi:hypothetical protein